MALHRLGVVDHIDQGRAAALGDGAERLLVDGRQAAFLVAGRGIVVDLGAEDAGVPLPPLDALDQLFADRAADGAARQQMLGAVDLGRFAEDAGAALGDEQIGGDAEGGVGGDAAVAVGAAAVGAEDRCLSAGSCVRRDVVDAAAAVRRSPCTPASTVLRMPPHS